MIVRAAMGVGLLALGYYVGREVGRAEHLRELLRSGRSEHVELDEDAQGADSPASPPAKDRNAEG